MGARIFATIPVGPLACNCSVVVDEATGEAAVVDPGDEPQVLLDALSRAGAKAVLLLHTHAHFDHIGATGALREATGAAVCLHPDDEALYLRLPEQGRAFGFSFASPPPIDRTIADGEILRFGESRFLALHTPGHSPGSACFLLESGPGALFSGDTLFRDSIGRTDLWGGSFPAIAASIREKLYVLPETLLVIPGHGEPTTIGEEKRNNPFVRPLLC